MCHAEGGDFTSWHQLSINGKTTGFHLADLKHLADFAGLPRGRERRILREVTEAFAGWRERAEVLGVPESIVQHVVRTQRLQW